MGLGVLFQGIPPEATEYFRVLVGVFGLPGAVAFVLAGVLLVRKLRGQPDAKDDGKIIAALERIAQHQQSADASLERAFTSFGKQLAEDLADGIQKAQEQTVLLVIQEIRERDLQQRERERRA